MEVIWSEEALNNYLRIIDYLYEKWSEKQVVKFETKFNNLVGRLRNNTRLCPWSQQLNCRKCQIDKQNALIYTELNGEIFLVSIIDNRSQHSY